MSLGLLISSTVIAIAYPNVLFFLDFLGGFFGVIFVSILPSTLYIGIFRMHIKGISYLSLKGILLMMMNLVLFTAGVVSIIITA